MRVEIENWPRVTPLRITGYEFDAVDVLVVTLTKDKYVGRGEGRGVYYRNDSPGSMLTQIDSVRKVIERGISRELAQHLLPPGGARNALDCALWDLEAKITSHTAWQIAGLSGTRPLLTTITCGADTPENMAAAARRHSNARAIKLKLTGEVVDVARVGAVRKARPDVWLGVDANQGFSRDFLEQIMPILVQERVALIEQPFKIGSESLLDGVNWPIDIAADESVQTLEDIAHLVGRFDVVNIKLDKCGGLTEGLEMAKAARALGLSTMVGNMMGTSLAMAPAFILGQLCSVVDLDGPLGLRADRQPSVRYVDGCIDCPQSLWGSG